MHNSRLRRSLRRMVFACGLACTVLTIPAVADAAVTVEQILKFRPVHFDQEYDIPEPAQVAACKLNIIRLPRSSGYEVVGPQGQTIRRFMDTNGDNAIDQRSFYHNGLEVYRDSDTNGNNKIDQSRWLNTGGSRWGIDANEDGRIESWKVISPEEVSQVVVRAFIKQDAALLSSLLVTKEDFEQLGIGGGVDRKILETIQDPETHLRKIAANYAAFLNPNTKWLQFNGSSPSTIPAESLSLREDLSVYENSMAAVDLGGGAGGGAANTGLIQLGELLRVGNVWKLTGLPLPMGTGREVMATGLLMQAGANSGQKAVPGAEEAPDPKTRLLIQQLQDLDKQAPPVNAGRADYVRYYRARLAVLDQLVAASRGNQNQMELWIRQIADFLASGIQSDNYPEGTAALKRWADFATKANPESPLAIHITYRQMLGDYSIAMKQASNDQRQQSQTAWLKQFEEFANKFPRSEEAADAAWQIAVINEFNGSPESQEVARKWYERLGALNVQSQATERAKGALKRLNLANNTLSLSGPNLQGQQLDIRSFHDNSKLILVIFWSTWCKPCTEDLPALKALYQEFHPKGFNIIGVNLDTQQQLIAPYIQKHGVEWNSIYEGGGLESPLAREYGIISLPTMFLVDSKGKVINRNAAVVDVKNELKKAFK